MILKIINGLRYFRTLSVTYFLVYIIFKALIKQKMKNHLKKLKNIKKFNFILRASFE